jgi:hypothetical protein
VLSPSLTSSSSRWSNVSGFQLVAPDATASSRASFDGYRSWMTSRVRGDHRRDGAGGRGVSMR